MEELRNKSPSEWTDRDITLVEEALSKKGIGPDQLTPTGDGDVIIGEYADVERFMSDSFNYGHPALELIKFYENPEDMANELGVDSDSVPDHTYIELISHIRSDVTDKIYAVTGTSNPESAFWKMQQDNHKYYQMLKDATEDTFTFNIPGNKDDKQLELTLEAAGNGSNNIKDILRDRIVQYIHHTSLNPWNIEIRFNEKNLDDWVQMIVSHDLLFDAYDAVDAVDGDFQEDFFGNIWHIQQYGWGRQDENNSYSEMFGKYSNMVEPLINDDDEDIFLEELKNGNSKIDAAKFLENFEREFRLSESKSSNDELATLTRLLR